MKTFNEALVKMLTSSASEAIAEGRPAEALDNLLVANAYLPGDQALRNALYQQAGREDATYTKEFFTISREGHSKPSLSFGAPALIWHLGLWARRSHGSGELQYSTVLTDRANVLRDQINVLLRHLRQKGRVPTSEGLGVTAFDQLNRIDESRKVDKDFGPRTDDAIGFTLWWSDRPKETGSNEPPPECLRVRMQASLQPDFASLTFVIDSGKRWNHPRLFLDDWEDERNDRLGCRRQAIFAAARAIRRHADRRQDSDPAGVADIVPESNVSPETAKELLEASNLLYQDIWDQFCTDFGCSLLDIAGEKLEVFANVRGLVLSTPTEVTAERTSVSRFVSHPEKDATGGSCAGSVVRSYWPFIRRICSEADHRDWVVCGVSDWRALYISALGSHDDLVAREEADIRSEKVEFAELSDFGGKARKASLMAEAPAGFLPKRARHGGEHIAVIQRRLRQMVLEGAPAVGLEANRLMRALSIPETELEVPLSPDNERPEPSRYLMLTSGEPQPQVLGRTIDRLHSVATLRGHALKDFDVMRNADLELLVSGQLLDQVARAHFEEREALHRAYFERAYANARSVIGVMWSLRQDFSGLEGSDNLLGACANCMDALEREWTKIKRRTTDHPHRTKGLASGELGVSERPLSLYLEFLGSLSAVAQEGATGGKPKKNVLLVAQRALDGERRARRHRDEQLAVLNRELDAQIMTIASAFDELSRDGLRDLVHRSRYYSEAVQAELRGLKVHPIETWLELDDQIATKAGSVLRFLASVDARLRSHRQRLRQLMEVVETNALILQSEATRENTAQLEAIAQRTLKFHQGLRRLSITLAVSLIGITIMGILNYLTKAPLW